MPRRPALEPGSPRNWIAWFITALFIIFGLFLFILAFLPYEPLKSLTSAFTRDGNFNSLKPGNAGVFKVLFGTGGLVFFALAALTGLRRWHIVWSFIKRFGTDARCFFANMRPQKNDLGFLAAVLVIMALAVVYRLEYINRIMRHDEAYTYLAFAHSLFAAITDYHLPNNHVFHSVLVFLSTRIFGIQPWAVRLPAFTAGVLLVPAVYWLAKRLYDRWTGLGAALLVAWLPTFIDYSTNARGYTLVAFFTLLTLALGSIVRKQKNLFAWMLISLFSALGLYTVPVMLFPFGILFVWLFLENQVEGVTVPYSNRDYHVSGQSNGPGTYRSKLDFLSYWVAAGFGAAILTILFYTPILVFTGPAKVFANSIVAPLSWADFLPTLFGRLSETWAQWTYQVPLVVVLLLVVGWTLSLVFHRKLSSIRVPLQLAALLWIVALLIIQRPNAWERVWLSLLPLMLLWAAAGIVGLLEKIRLKRLHGLPIAMAVVGLAMLVGIWHAVWLAPQLPPAWATLSDEEKAVLFVQGQLQNDDLIVTALQDNTPVWYYFKLHGIMDAQYNPSRPFNRVLVLTDSAEGETLASVIAERSPTPVVLDFESCNLLGSFGKMQVFVCPRK